MAITLQDEFQRLLDTETVWSLETRWILAADADDWECVEHDGCRPL